MVSNENVYLADIDTSTVIDMSELFKYSKRVNFSGIECWDVSNVLNMADMFNGAKHFNVALDEWDLNKNINFNGMFDNTSVSFKEIFKYNKSLKKYHPKTKDELKKLVNDKSIFLGRIDTSAITDMSELFKDSGRKDFSGIESWDVSNVENMSSMFDEAENFNGDILNWDIKDEINIDNLGLQNYPENFTIPKNENGKYKPKKALELYFLVRNKTIALRDIDTSKITNMSGLFAEMDRDDFDDISGWDVSNVKNMGGMFWGAKNFNSDISKWDVSKVKNMSDMFNGAKHFNVALDEWDLNKNINFNGMFDNTSVSFKEIFKYNKSLKKYHPQTKNELKKLVNDENIFLGRIDTSAITDMSELFKDSGRAKIFLA